MPKRQKLGIGMAVYGQNSLTAINVPFGTILERLHSLPQTPDRIPCATTPPAAVLVQNTVSSMDIDCTVCST